MVSETVNHFKVPPEIAKAIISMWHEMPDARQIPAIGRSMYPLIREGDRLEIVPPKGSFRVGDILVFYTEAGLVAHRVIKIQRQSGGRIRLIAKGDNVPRSDPPVPYEHVLGRVVRIIHADGRQTVLEARKWQIFGQGLAILSSLEENIYRVVERVRKITGYSGEFRGGGKKFRRRLAGLRRLLG